MEHDIKNYAKDYIENIEKEYDKIKLDKKIKVMKEKFPNMLFFYNMNKYSDNSDYIIFNLFGNDFIFYFYNLEEEKIIKIVCLKNYKNNYSIQYLGENFSIKGKYFNIIIKSKDKKNTLFHFKNNITDICFKFIKFLKQKELSKIKF